jgi:hypothetical protein
MISHKRNRATTKAGIESETRFVQDHRLHDNGRAGLDRDSSSLCSQNLALWGLTNRDFQHITTNVSYQMILESRTFMERFYLSL